MYVSDIIRKKGNAVVTLPPNATVAELLATLDDNHIGAVVVVDGDEVLGIVSERDVVRHLRASTDVSAHVDALMTSKLAWCGMKDDIQDLAATMTERRVRHVPVIEDGRLVAIVSIGDVVKHRLDELSAERDHLAGYVHG